MQSNNIASNQRSLKGKRVAAKASLGQISKEIRTTSDGLLRDLTTETIKSRETEKYPKKVIKGRNTKANGSNVKPPSAQSKKMNQHPMTNHMQLNMVKLEWPMAAVPMNTAMEQSLQTEREASPSKFRSNDFVSCQNNKPPSEQAAFLFMPTGKSKLLTSSSLPKSKKKIW